MPRLLGLFAIAASSVLAQDLEGIWLGSLIDKGVGSPVLFMFGKSPEKQLGGQVVSPIRNVAHPLGTISVRGREVRWEVPRLRAAFEGTLGVDGKAIKGAWSEPSGRQSLSLTRYNAQSYSVSFGSELDVFVSRPPVAVPAGGRHHLMYELHVTNWSASEANILSLQVSVDGKWFRIEGDGLSALFHSRSTRIGPGVRTAIILAYSSSTFPRRWSIGWW